MVDTRDVRRAEARRRQILTTLGADQREATKHLRIGKALDTMRSIAADGQFSKLVQAHGSSSMPTLLASEDRRALPETTLDRSLDFLVAWRFFSPLLYEPVIAHLLDTRWPGFGVELRDIFISIVSDGPFPHDLRGRPHRTL